MSLARNAEGKKMRIGEGGCGTVYKGVMHGCDEVAIKLVKDMHPGQEDQQHFRREVRQNKLKAPHNNNELVHEKAHSLACHERKAGVQV